MKKKLGLFLFAVGAGLSSSLALALSANCLYCQSDYRTCLRETRNNYGYCQYQYDLCVTRCEIV
ncbi:MAG: hypothetical protein RL748_1402 [Pseudomonadota bacterium]|jgi:hypothetical protein